MPSPKSKKPESSWRGLPAEPKPDTAERVLVLGGSGHVGSAIVRALAARRARITAIGRRPDPINLHGVAADYRTLDIDQVADLSSLVQGHGWVVDAAAPYPIDCFGRRHEPLERALRRIDAILAAVDRHEAHLTHVGSFVNTTHSPSGWNALESHWLRNLHPYFETKRHVEARIREARRGGLDTTIVQPTMCLGPWDLKATGLSIVARTLDGRLPAALGHWINVIDVRDVADSIVALRETPAIPDVVPLSGHNIDLGNLVRWVAELGEVPPPRVQVSPRVGLAVTTAREALAAVLGQRPTIPMLGPLLIKESRTMSPSAAQSRLGVAPRPLSETLHDTVAWYRSMAQRTT